MRVALGIPFFGHEPVRLDNYNFIFDHVGAMYPFDDVSSTTGNFNRGSARNDLVRRYKDFDVVVLCDADTFPEPDALSMTIEAAYNLGGLHFPFQHFRGLNPLGTAMLKAGVEGYGQHLEMECLGSMGGVIVIKPEDWWTAGGSPEMQGWGFEDVMFAVQARTLVRGNTWHPGWITHLWHGSECRVGSPSYMQNIGVCKTVEALDGDSAGIRRFIRESGLYP